MFVFVQGLTFFQQPQSDGVEATVSGEDHISGASKFAWMFLKQNVFVKIWCYICM